MVKVAYFGTPDFAVPTLERLLASPYPVVAVVTRPDRPRGRGQRVSPSPVKALAIRHGLMVLQPDRLKEPEFLTALSEVGADLGVVAAYGRILPDSVLELPRHRVINVHASLLPKYRGAAPIQRAVVAGERETGITIIRLVRDMDAGPMLARRVRPITPDETSEDVEHDLARIGADLLIETIGDIEAGRAREVEQDHSRATLAPRLTRDDGLIRWTAAATTIHDLVRGLHPWPLAFTFLSDARLVITRTSLLDAARRAQARGSAPDAQPGQILAARGDDLIVATGNDEVIAIREVQPEGRRRLDTRAFLAGHRLPVGTRFGAASAS